MKPLLIHIYTFSVLINNFQRGIFISIEGARVNLCLLKRETLAKIVLNIVNNH